MFFINNPPISPSSYKFLNKHDLLINLSFEEESLVSEFIGLNADDNIYIGINEYLNK